MTQMVRNQIAPQYNVALLLHLQVQDVKTKQPIVMVCVIIISQQKDRNFKRLKIPI
jgi:hypothetical protein